VVEKDQMQAVASIAAVEIELHELDLRYESLRRCDARRERALCASLAEVGQQSPVVVVRSDADKLVLVDGYKRVRVLRRLRRDTVRATRWEMSEAEALLLNELMRAGDGQSALEQGWLLRELHERFGLSSCELAHRFDKSESWVSRRLALVRELPELVQELVRKGDLVAHAAMKHLVPLARANRESCLKLAPVLAAHHLSSREVELLCAAFVSGSDESRELILTQPQLVLRAQQEALRPKERSPSERLLSDLMAIAGIARRARRLVLEDKRSRAAPSTGWSADMPGAAAAAEADATALFALLHKEVADARRTNPHSDSRAA
jgi:ParB/RepB/Spo0J family partition protein